MPLAAIGGYSGGHGRYWRPLAAMAAIGGNGGYWRPLAAFGGHCVGDAAGRARQQPAIAMFIGGGLGGGGADADEIARLQTFVNENLKRFEYRLRRENEGENTNPLFLAGSDEVPSGFRDLIEEYFRRLSQEEPSL